MSLHPRFTGAVGSSATLLDGKASDGGSDGWFREYLQQQSMYIHTPEYILRVLILYSVYLVGAPNKSSRI